jgi:bactofilin
MTLPKWKVALFNWKREMQPREIMQAIWHLPATEVIEPPALSLSPAEGNNAPPGQALPAPSEECNYLTEGSRLSGKFRFQGPARIDGEFDGEITATASVILGENSVVTAKIKAASIIVAGRFSGEMIVSDGIEILPSARVSGNLTKGQQGH